MTTATIDATTGPAGPGREAPFESIARRLMGSAGTITHAGNIGYTFGGGGMGLLARRYGMATVAPAVRHARHSTHNGAHIARGLHALA
jgi:hypothetical protein